MPETGKPEKLMDLKGTDLLGLPVKVRRGTWSAGSLGGSGACVAGSCMKLGIILPCSWKLPVGSMAQHTPHPGCLT